jgi:hypothetical protein
MGLDPRSRNMGERQLVFPFILEDNKLNGRTCVTCKNQKKCVDNGETISIEHTCGDWAYDIDREQEEDAAESMEIFDTIIDKYCITDEDKKLLYIHANKF